MGESGDGDLEGASAVVTGAAQGLGLGIARELAGQGACVVAADLQLEKAETECARLRAEGLDARAAALDVTDSAAVDSFFAKLGRVDILINNAGVGQQLAPISELPDAEYPLVLTTERSLYQYHTSTMTGRVEGLNMLRGQELVEINPQDASPLGIKDGDTVVVNSRRGTVTATAKATYVSPLGVVSMTFHFAESPTNFLTNPALDPVAKIPETKVCAVRVEKAGARSRAGGERKETTSAT